jgi:hypothetical protein
MACPPSSNRAYGFPVLHCFFPFHAIPAPGRYTSRFLSLFKVFDGSGMSRIVEYLTAFSEVTRGCIFGKIADLYLECLVLKDHLGKFVEKSFVG